MKHFLVTIILGFVFLIAIFVLLVVIPASKGRSVVPEQKKEDIKSDQIAKASSKSGKVKTDRKLNLIEKKRASTEHILKTYYDSGVVSSEWQFKDGKMEGRAKMYDSNGALFREMAFSEDELQGTARTFYPNGSIKTACRYAESRLEGACREFYPNGALWIRMEFKEGKMTGPPAVYSETGDVEKAVLKASEFAMAYSGGGEALGEDRILPNDGRSLLRTYYAGGKTVSSEWNMKDDQFEGVGRLFDEKGNVTKEMMFAAGVLSGPLRAYDASGNMRSEMTFLNGAAEGTAKDDYPNGVRWVSTSFLEGKMNAPPMAYSESGKIFETVPSATLAFGDK